MEEIVIIGGGGHARSVIGIVKQIEAFNIIGYTDPVDQGSVLGVRYLGTDDVLGRLKDENKALNAVIALGMVNTESCRAIVKEKLDALGIVLPVIQSPKANIAEDVSIGGGTVIHDGALINVGSHIGECAIINSGSCIEHDCRIGDFSHIAPCSTLGGGVQVGCNSLIGIGSTVAPQVKIGDHCLIGAGATVIKDCEAGGTYIGVPAERRNEKITV